MGVAFSGILGLSGCVDLKGGNLQEYKETRPYFGAYVTIHCFYDTRKDIPGLIKKCWERIDEIEQRMNAYAQKGDLAELNRSGISGARVHQDVYLLLEYSLSLSKVTKGAFDVTVFPLVEFWKNVEKEGRLPDKAAVAAAQSRVGYQNLRLEGRGKVSFSKQGMKVDLGGIVSGYACDEVAAILESHKINNFLIDTGGEVLCRGKNKGGVPWLIGIQDPQDKNKLIMTVELKDRCVSTSGNYEKFYTIEGEKLSHIIDPASGYPQKGTISVTVIAKTGKEADALSTALCVLGREKGMALIQRLPAVEALIVESKDGRIARFQTKSFPNRS